MLTVSSGSDAWLGSDDVYIFSSMECMMYSARKGGEPGNEAI